MPFPAFDVLHPMPEQPRVVLLKPLVKSPLIEVGEYSYYDDPDDPTAFESRNVHPPPVPGGRHRPPEPHRLVGLAARPHHPACSGDHVRHG